MICLGHEKRHQGYTFLELALAMAIVAVVFIATVPLISSSMDERRLRQDMSAIEQFIRQERLTAEESGGNRDVTIGGHELSTGEGRRCPVDGQVLVRDPEGRGDRGQSQRWPIYGCSLVAPVSLRIEKGRFWIEGDFDPLTGSIAEERYSF